MNCPICTSNSTSIFHKKVWHLKNARVMRCMSCGITFIYPLMTEQKEKIFYTNYNKHVKARGVTISSNTNEFHKACIPAAKARFANIGKRLKKYNDFLEIGASTGAFLEVMKKNMPRKTFFAVEPCTENRIYSMKFATDVYENIHKIPKDKHFDAIAMFHVFEHMKNPIDFLKKCKSLLRQNGILLIEVPFIEDPLISLYNCESFKDFYFQPMHPYVYSLKSLRYVFSKAGFKERSVTYCQRYSLDNHLVWLSKNRPGGDVRLKTILGDNILYKRSLENAGKTDTCFYEAGL